MKRRVVPVEPDLEIDTIWRQTDTGMARRFVDSCGHLFRHCEDLGGWLYYDGTRFQRKATAAAYQRITETADAIWTELPQAPPTHRKDLARFAARADSAQGKAAALALARYLPPVPATVEDFDRNPWTLNTPTGTVDLRTGTLRAHRAADLLTKRTAAPFDADAACPLWLDFLALVFEHNAVLIDYVQRALGYSITGDVSEHVLFFPHGSGRNGKSTMLGTVQAVLGDYARTADPELLLQRRGEVHPTNIAALHGARFVTSIETEDGRRFAEVLVKWLTGGDRLTARLMRQDFFDFDPTHHIWLAANHKPAVRGSDAGIWSRIHLIPFAVHLPTALGDAYDPQFRSRLLSEEAAGILRWLVEGCLGWQRHGLNPPAEVLAATEAYRREMDVLDRFITERCTEVPSAKVAAGALYSAYKAWSDDVGEWRMPKVAFTDGLKARRGLSWHKSNSGAFWIGLALAESDER